MFRLADTKVLGEEESSTTKESKKSSGSLFNALGFVL